MSKASEVAAELRKLADALDSSADAQFPKAYIYLMVDTRDEFRSAVRLLPRPLTKSIKYEGKDYEELCLSYDSEGAHIAISVPRNQICRLIKPAIPAVYSCDSILSDEEEAELGVTA